MTGPEPVRSEKQRMLAGELYLSADPELVAERLRARQQVREYDATAPAETARRAALLAGLFGRLGAPVEIEPPFHCDYGYNIDAGSGLYMNVGCVVLDCAAVTIGSNVLCAPYVQIYTAYHPLDPEVRRQGRELARPVAIGDDVWLGGGVIVCPGVSIGEGTTIAAGSVVTRDIPSRVLAAGNPCRVLRPLEAKG
jgi:maltose O-acetyltransferase